MYEYDDNPGRHITKFEVFITYASCGHVCRYLENNKNTINHDDCHHMRIPWFQWFFDWGYTTWRIIFLATAISAFWMRHWRQSRWNLVILASRTSRRFCALLFMRSSYRTCDQFRCNATSTAVLFDKASFLCVISPLVILLIGSAVLAWVGSLSTKACPFISFPTAFCSRHA